MVHRIGEERIVADPGDDLRDDSRHGKETGAAPGVDQHAKPFPMQARDPPRRRAGTHAGTRRRSARQSPASCDGRRLRAAHAPVATATSSPRYPRRRGVLVPRLPTAIDRRARSCLQAAVDVIPSRSAASALLKAASGSVPSRCRARIARPNARTRSLASWVTPARTR